MGMNIEEKLIKLISDTVTSKFSVELEPGMVMVEIPKIKLMVIIQQTLQ